MIKLVTTGLALVFLTAPSFAATYYIVKDPATKECTVVEQKTDGQQTVGNADGYPTMADAESAKAAACDQ